jgi:RsmE family RNA methyltransferase
MAVATENVRLGQRIKVFLLCVLSLLSMFCSAKLSTHTIAGTRFRTVGGRVRCSIPNLSNVSPQSTKKNIQSFVSEDKKDILWKLPRIYSKDLCETQTHYTLNNEDAHYISNIMRLKNGAKLRVFNEESGEFLAELSMSGSRKKDVAFSTVQQIRSPHKEENNDLTSVLYFAPIKKTRMKILLEKCTELGIKHLIPVNTQNTQHFFDSSAVEQNEKYLVQSAEQCERLTIPILHSPISFKELVSDLHGVNYDRELTSKLVGTPGTPTVNIPLLVCAERIPKSSENVCVVTETSSTVAVKPLMPELYRLLTPGILRQHEEKINNTATIEVERFVGARFGLFVGPEGGFTAAELQALSDCTQVTLVTLGNNILRAETAAVSVVSAVALVSDAMRSHSS